MNNDIFTKANELIQAYIEHGITDINQMCDFVKETLPMQLFYDFLGGKPNTPNNEEFDYIISKFICDMNFDCNTENLNGSTLLLDLLRLKYQMSNSLLARLIKRTNIYHFDDFGMCAYQYILFSENEDYQNILADFLHLKHEDNPYSESNGIWEFWREKTKEFEKFMNNNTIN